MGERGKRTDLVRNLHEVGVVGDGDDEALERSDGGGEGEDLRNRLRKRRKQKVSGVRRVNDGGERKSWTHASSSIGFTSPEGVLEKRVEDSSDTEGGLDDVGSELSDRVLGGFEGDGEVGWEKLVDDVVDGDRGGADIPEEEREAKDQFWEGREHEEGRAKRSLTR